ncbi:MULTISPECIES: oligopeptide ABC transporter permease [Clostridium]|uniref:oligopeptide ABC transporter permease n=1 Tax=Clostridium TaxID=1485 RepID=UPI000824A858|nr:MULTISPECIES: oligopeptide ABC transporter permease [Clostridium]PJI09672.1 ABC transporter permease [Clostridium sp. CT7]
MGFYKSTFMRIKRNKFAVIGIIIIAIMIIFCFIGPLLTGYSGDDISYIDIKSSPSIEHVLGTDKLGRDVFTRLMYGGRVSLIVGIFSVLFEVVIGTTFGMISGYYGGIIDSIIMRFSDIIISIPVLPILIVLGAILSDIHISSNSRVVLLIINLALLQWPSLARIVRGEVLSIRNREFMLAADALGISTRRKMVVHILPNVLPSIIVFSTLCVGSNIIFESTLSFLGLGITEPTPSWGNMIQGVNDFYTFNHYPWLWIPAGICIFLTVMSINLVGDALRDEMDVK